VLLILIEVKTIPRRGLQQGEKQAELQQHLDLRSSVRRPFCFAFALYPQSAAVSLTLSEQPAERPSNATAREAATQRDQSLLAPVLLRALSLFGASRFRCARHTGWLYAQGLRHSKRRDGKAETKAYRGWRSQECVTLCIEGSERKGAPFATVISTVPRLEDLLPSVLRHQGL
jgi:hypothetical protein